MGVVWNKVVINLPLQLIILGVETPTTYHPTRPSRVTREGRPIKVPTY